MSVSSDNYVSIATTVSTVHAPKEGSFELTLREATQNSD